MDIRHSHKNHVTSSSNLNKNMAHKNSKCKFRLKKLHYTQMQIFVPVYIELWAESPVTTQFLEAVSNLHKMVHNLSA